MAEALNYGESMSNNILKGFISQLEKTAIETDFTTLDDRARSLASQPLYSMPGSAVVGGMAGAGLGTLLRGRLGKTSLMGASLGAALAALLTSRHNSKVEASKRWLTKAETEKARTNTNEEKPFSVSWKIPFVDDVTYYQKKVF